MFSGVGVWVYVEADQYLVLIFKKFNVTITLLHFEIGRFVAESIMERIKSKWHQEVESN